MIRIILAAAFSAAVFSQQPAPNAVTIDDLMEQESADSFDIAPDGARAVYVKHVPDEKKNEVRGAVWIVDLATGKARALTKGSAVETSPTWSPDGRRVAFLSARPTDDDKEKRRARRSAGRKDAEDDPKTQLFVLSMDGGEAQPATKLSEGVVDYAWAGSDRIVVAARERLARDEKARKDAKDETDAVEDLGSWRLQAVRLFVVTLENGAAKSTARLTENEDHVENVVASPDGELAVAVHQRTPLFGVDAKVPPRIMVWNLKTGAGREIFGDRKSRPQAFFWSGDGRTLFAAGNHPSIDGEDLAGVTVAYAIDRETLAPVELDFGWPAGLAQGQPTACDGGFLALLASGARPKAARIAMAGPAPRRANLEGEARDVRAIVSRPGVGRVLYRTSTASDAGGWHVGHLDGDKLALERDLEVCDAPFEGRTLAKSEIVKFAGAKGDEIEGVLFKPLQHREGEKHPLILMTHGGPHALDWDALMDGWAYAPNLYAARGAYVLAVNYHGSSEYGLAFSESIRGRYLELELIDLSKAIDFVAAKDPVDRDRLGLVGWSNGAILSAAMLALAPDFVPGFDQKFRVCVVGAGEANFISDYGPCEFGVEFDDYYLGGPPWKICDAYLKKSGLFHADRVTTPTIIFAGSDDRAVPTGQAWEWYRALQQLGKADVKFFLFPGEKHSLKKLSHRRRKIEEELAFVEKHLFGVEKPTFAKEGSPLWAASRDQTPARTGLGVGLSLPGLGAHPESQPVREVLIPETVRVGGILLGRFEVTCAQWQSFMPSFEVPPSCRDYPVSGITFEQASAYVAWLSERTRWKYRLPTHDELKELVDEAGDDENTLDWWMGGKPSAVDVADLRRDFERLAIPQACPEVPPLLLPVGSRPPAAIGSKGSKVAIYDLGGNVAEWTTPDEPKPGESRPSTRPAVPKPIGGCAFLPSDPGTSDPAPPAAYVGLRVVREK